MCMKVKIKEVARKNKQWSLYKLAHVLGLPQQTIYSWASARTQPSYENMDKLCEALECSLNELFKPETSCAKSGGLVNFNDAAM